MKTVFSSYTELVKAFVSGQNEGRHANVSIFFQNGVMYSYGTHYPLAEIVKGKTAWVNDTPVSPTTSRHSYKVRWELHDLGYQVVWESDVNKEEVLETVKEIRDKLSRARKPKMYRAQLRNKYERFLDAQRKVKRTGFAEDLRTSEARQIKKLCDV